MLFEFSHNKFLMNSLNLMIKNFGEEDLNQESLRLKAGVLIFRMDPSLFCNIAFVEFVFH